MNTKISGKALLKAARPAAADDTSVNEEGAVNETDTPYDNDSVSVSPEKRQEWIAVAAYYLAEQRNFTGGNEAEDWLQAEQLVDKLLQAN